MIFSSQALVEAAERGGDRTCPNCGVKCLFYAFTPRKTDEGLVIDTWCPACHDHPHTEPWLPRQPKLPMEVPT